MGNVYDVIITGSGLAGLSAAIYAQRAKLVTLVPEREVMSGGQALNTYGVDNYLGLLGINGYDMRIRFRNHADSLRAEPVIDEVIRIEVDDVVRRVMCENDAYEVKSIVIVTGAAHWKLGVPGEEEPIGMGVSYCATCDGAFLRKKVIAVVGGSDVALEDVIFPARVCEKVYVLRRRDEFRGAKTLQERLMEQESVEILWGTMVDEIRGDGKVNSLKITNKKTGVPSEFPVDGVFIAIGITPNSQKFEGLLEMDHSYIAAAEDCKTSVPGILTADSVKTKQLRRIATAVSDGANTVTSVERYLTEHQKDRWTLENRDFWVIFRGFF